ncbi:MAG: type II secretion system major pseudopilin GspG [bacterium]|nr:type II secretion system major pseudopilin GspG [bacterium]
MKIRMMNACHRHGRLRGRRNAAFTMIEIILVVMIIMTLMAVVGPRLVGKGKQAKINATKIQMGNIKTALQEFEVNASRFPTTSEGLEALIKKPSDLDDNEWPGKYMDELPKDSWGQPFQYTCPSEHGKDYDLVSAGPNKQFGDDNDITNYSSETPDEKL